MKGVLPSIPRCSNVHFYMVGLSRIYSDKGIIVRISVLQGEKTSPASCHLDEGAR
jgi:hypothetical protein